MDHAATQLVVRLGQKTIDQIQYLLVPRPIAVPLRWDFREARELSQMPMGKRDT